MKVFFNLILYKFFKDSTTLKMSEERQKLDGFGMMEQNLVGPIGPATNPIWTINMNKTVSEFFKPLEIDGATGTAGTPLMLFVK